MEKALQLFDEACRATEACETRNALRAVTGVLRAILADPLADREAARKAAEAEAKEKAGK